MIVPRIFIPLIRKEGFLQAEKLFILACEGTVTEPKYFERLRHSEWFNHSGLVETIVLKKPKNHGNDPVALKNLLKKVKRDYRFKKTDEFWLVVDRDHWEEIHKISFDVIVRDFEREGNFFLALSNPCFELWLILHYLDISTLPQSQIRKIELNQRVESKSCTQSILGELIGRGYNKIPPRDLLQHTRRAIERAQRLEVSGQKYPTAVGTHVHRLVQKLIQ